MHRPKAILGVFKLKKEGQRARQGKLAMTYHRRDV
jgi:hypothetical protein